MANYKLTAKPFTCNDVVALTQLFDAAFTYHLDPKVLFYPQYLRTLRTVIGLGYTAILAHGAFMREYDRLIRPFFAAEAGDFQACPAAKSAIAQATAELVQLGSQCFYHLRYPDYYPAFFQQLRLTWQGVQYLDSSLNQHAKRLLLRLC